jgi:hypothetical protein
MYINLNVSLKIKLKQPFVTFQGFYLSKASIYCYKIPLFDIDFAVMW